VVVRARQIKSLREVDPDFSQLPKRRFHRDEFRILLIFNRSFIISAKIHLL
jgi:hypothetical protein